MSTSTLVQELTQANRELDEAERLVANLAAADKRGEKVDEQEWRRRLETLERLLAPEFRITRATGKVDDREGFLAVVKSGDRSYRSHQTSVEEVKALGDTGVLTGLIETDGEYRGKPVGGRFRFTTPVPWNRTGRGRLFRSR